MFAALTRIGAAGAPTNRFPVHGDRRQRSRLARRDIACTATWSARARARSCGFPALRAARPVAMHAHPSSPRPRTTG